MLISVSVFFVYIFFTYSLFLLPLLDSTLLARNSVLGKKLPPALPVAKLVLPTRYKKGRLSGVPFQ